MQNERKATSKSNRQIKDDRLVIRMSAKKKKEIYEKAKEADLTMSAYMLSQLIKPDWVKEIRQLPSRPLGTLTRPPSAPRTQKKMIETLGSREAIRMRGVIGELKQVMISGFDSVLEKFEHKPPSNIEQLEQQKLREINERKMDDEKDTSDSV